MSESLSAAERAELEAARTLIAHIKHDPGEEVPDRVWEPWADRRDDLQAAYDQAARAVADAPPEAQPSVNLRTAAQAIVERLAEAETSRQVKAMQDDGGSIPVNIGLLRALRSALGDVFAEAQPLTLTAYQQQAMRTAATLTAEKKTVNSIFGLAGETGELARLVMLSNPDLSEFESPITRLLQLIATVGYLVDQVKKIAFHGHDPMGAMGYNNLLSMVRSAATESMMSEMFNPMSFDCPAITMPDVTKLKDESGDVFWYLALLATATGLDLGDVAQGNLDKLQRRYGGAFSSAASINRAESE